MSYEYVKSLFNVNPMYSSKLSLWKHNVSNNYYVSFDLCETIKPSIDHSYMLLSENQKIQISNTRNYLSKNAKVLTTLDYLNGTVEYGGSYWKLNEN